MTSPSVASFAFVLTLVVGCGAGRCGDLTLVPQLFGLARSRALALAALRAL